jgi:hypothetical protein
MKTITYKASVNINIDVTVSDSATDREAEMIAHEAACLMGRVANGLVHIGTEIEQHDFVEVIAEAIDADVVEYSRVISN